MLNAKREKQTTSCRPSATRSAITRIEIDRFAFVPSIDRAWPARRASCWRWHRATHSSATAFPLGQAPPRADIRPRPAPLWLVSGRSRPPLPPQPPTLSPPHPQPHPNPPLGARGERDAVRLPRDIRGPEVVYGTHVDHFDRAPRQLTPLPSLLQACARCCAAGVGKLVVDKAFAVDFPAERGQDGLRGGWARPVPRVRCVIWAGVPAGQPVQPATMLQGRLRPAI